MLGNGFHRARVWYVLCFFIFLVGSASALSAVNSGIVNRLVVATTTTSLASGASDVRCEAVSNANEKTCMAGICSKGYECDYIMSAAAANAGYCKCVSTTTTTIPSEIKCEAVKYPSSNTCSTGVCPDGSRCRFVPSTANVAAVVGSCKCISDSTTTTTLPATYCERILKPQSSAVCEAGACPQGTRCMLKPKVQVTANIAALSPSGENSCVCVEYTTTTTIYPRCEGIRTDSGPVCMRGACPPNTVCRLKQRAQPQLAQVSSSVQQATNLNSAGENTTNRVAVSTQEMTRLSTTLNLPDGSCECVPCDCIDSTTTTLPQQIRCERVVNPSANTCEVGVCPVGQKCRVFTATSEDSKISKCICIGESTTTTLPGIKCDGLTANSQERCSQALCPQGYKCKYYPPAATNAAANTAGSCRCAQDTTPTTTISPQEVLCENVVSPSGNTCEPAKCPDGQKCRVFTAVLANTQVSKCACVGPETTTTLQSGVCEELNPQSGQTCAQGRCSEGLECRYVAETAAANIGRCKCMEKATTTTLRQVKPAPSGLLDRIMQALFG